MSIRSLLRFAVRKVADMAAAGTLDELPEWVCELLEEARVAHLGLLDHHGRPRVLPVTFAMVEGSLWSAVDHKKKGRPGNELARVRWVRGRPIGSITVDRYDDDWEGLAWVQLLGAIAVIERTGHDDSVIAALMARYPQYRERPPGGPLLRLTPERSVWWRSAGDGAA